MIVTEDEAKTKICCGGTGCGQHVPVINSIVPTDSYERRCIGSACMAWRWETESVEAQAAGSTSFRPKLGYCGKAGRP